MASFDPLLDAPLLLVGPGIVLLLSLSALIGLALVRRHNLPRLRVTPGDSDFTGAMDLGLRPDAYRLVYDQLMKP